MFKFIEFLKKRPSDTTIRATRAILSLGIALLLILQKDAYELPWQSYYTAYADIAKYAVAALFIGHAILFGGFGICFCRRGVMRKLQMATGFSLIILGNLFSIVTPEPVATDAVTISQLSVAEDVPVSVGFWVALYGALILIAGISGKMITAKCLKHGEVITKIRV